MPSLLGTDVAANYGRMTAQQTYGVGTLYSNFGTRQLRFIQVTAVAANGSTAVNFSTNYTDPLSSFAKAIRAVQTVAEIYYINIPNATGFVVAVSEDTVNDSDSGNVQGGGYGDLEAAIVAGLGLGGSSAATVAAFTIAAA